MQTCHFSPTHIYYYALRYSSAICTSINHSSCYRESLSPAVRVPCRFSKECKDVKEQKKPRLTKLLCINLLFQCALKQCINKLLVTAKRCTQHMAHCFNEYVWCTGKEALPLARMQTSTFKGVRSFWQGQEFWWVTVTLGHRFECIFTWLITTPKFEDTIFKVTFGDTYYRDNPP